MLAAFQKRHITFVPCRGVSAPNTARGVVMLDDGSEMPHDLCFGVPKHRAPEMVLACGMAEEGYVPVKAATLETRFPGMYALGDVATVGLPKAGVFAEGQARIVAASLIARLTGGESAAIHEGRGSCFVEFGGGRVGRIDVDFFSGRKPTGTLEGPSAALVAEKEHFGSSRRARWFGR